MLKSVISFLNAAEAILNFWDLGNPTVSLWDVSRGNLKLELISVIFIILMLILFFHS